MKKYALILGCALLASPAFAAKDFSENLYFGGGVGINDLDGFDDANGFQIFGGYDFDFVRLGKASLSAEVGYMDSGEFEQEIRFMGRTFTAESDATGLWANGVISFPVGNTVDLIGRAGLDFGDDDGFMVGGGVGIDLSKAWELRFEYVMRDNIDSIQANIAFSL
jgi:opacity protein-like surface antigen